MLAAKQKLHIHVDRVESKSNPADDPSRWHFQHLESTGFRFVPPSLDVFTQRQADDPTKWFTASP
eukprot:1742286-Amphidinium_carterae.1